VPRRINLLCDRALLGAYAQQRTTVNAAMVDQAAREVFGDAGSAARQPYSPRRVVGVWVAAATLAAVTAGMWWGWPRLQGLRAVPATAAATATTTPTPTGQPTSAIAALPPLLDAAALVARHGWADEDAAWRALAARWGDGTDLSGGRDAACDSLATAGLACYRGQGTLALLRQLDRPLWLALQLGSPTSMPVLLTGLGERDAELRLPDGTLRVSLATLTARWTGEFGTLWRRSPGLAAPGRVVPGSEAFTWVEARLRDEQAGALPADSSATVRIQAFQRSQGLAVDGLAGPLTLMQLNRAAGVDEPRLRREP
jgi:general secretion pathway protein A